MTEAASLDVLLSHLADKPVAMARMARVLLAMGQSERARSLCERAVAMAPNEGEVLAIAAEIRSRDVPSWHFSLVRDDTRNDAYAAALRRAVGSDSRVLEIGTGTGILAMAAARAGAAEVATCECNPAIAAAATEIVANNGYADRIRVIPMQSGDLEVGVNLDWHADVLVSEIVSNNMLGEGVLTAMEQAVRRLVKPGAKIIPARGTIRVALAEDRKFQTRQMGVVDGFDLSPFNRLAAPNYRIKVGDNRLGLRSGAADLFCFDFSSGGPFPEAIAAVPLSSSGGRVNGIAQWIRLELDKDGWYENAPDTGPANSAWAVLFYPLARPIEMAAGDILTVHGSHDRSSLRVWAQLPELG